MGLFGDVGLVAYFWELNPCVRVGVSRNQKNKPEMSKKKNVPKAHHYVPQTYLRKFAFSKGKAFYIHVLDKNQTEKEKIFFLNTKNVCQETHLYTLNTDKLDPATVEKFFSNNIESYYNKLQNILTDDSLNISHLKLERK